MWGFVISDSGCDEDMSRKEEEEEEEESEERKEGKSKSAKWAGYCWSMR